MPARIGLGTRRETNRPEACAPDGCELPSFFSKEPPPTGDGTGGENISIPFSTSCANKLSKPPSIFSCYETALPGFAFLVSPTFRRPTGQPGCPAHLQSQVSAPGFLPSHPGGGGGFDYHAESAGGHGVRSRGYRASSCRLLRQTWNCPPSLIFEALARCLKKLPVALLKLVNLHYWDDLKQTEIAAQKNRPEGTVNYQIDQAKKLLKSCLEASRDKS